MRAKMQKYGSLKIAYVLYVHICIQKKHVNTNSNNFMKMNSPESLDRKDDT